MSHVATIRIHQKEVRSELTCCGSGFEPSLQTLMYDIPLLSNLILHPLIYVSFHSSYWCQTELEEEKLLEILDIMSTTF